MPLTSTLTVEIEMSTAHPVLFLPRHATSWSKMIGIAEIINLDGRYQSLMLLTTPQMSQMGQNSEKVGVKSVDVSKQIMNALDEKNNRIFIK